MYVNRTYIHNSITSLFCGWKLEVPVAGARPWARPFLPQPSALGPVQDVENLHQHQLCTVLLKESCLGASISGAKELKNSNPPNSNQPTIHVHHPFTSDLHGQRPRGTNSEEVLITMLHPHEGIHLSAGRMGLLQKWMVMARMGLFQRKHFNAGVMPLWSKRGRRASRTLTNHSP